MSRWVSLPSATCSSSVPRPSGNKRLACSVDPNNAICVNAASIKPLVASLVGLTLICLVSIKIPSHRRRVSSSRNSYFDEQHSRSSGRLGTRWSNINRVVSRYIYYVLDGPQLLLASRIPFAGDHVYRVQNLFDVKPLIFKISRHIVNRTFTRSGDHQRLLFFLRHCDFL